MSFCLKMLAYNDIQSNVKTPKDSPVTAWITDESSEATRASYDNYWALTRPDADQIETYDGFSSTRRFNCHGYAWHIIEGGSDRWIGYHYTTEEDIYMTDGSYVQVVNEMYPGKVSWGSGDHSAITTSQAGRYKSKWNEWPLMEHDWDDTPFGTTNLKYYVSTSISGSSSVLCNNSTRNFSARNIPNADYDWTVGPGLTLNSDGNYNTSVTANSSYSCETWIEVEITSPLGGSNEDVKTSPRVGFWVWVGTPIPGISGAYDPACHCQTFMPEVGEEYYFWALTENPSTNNSDYYWKIYPPAGANLGYDYTVDYGKKIYFTAPVEGTYTFMLKQNWTCGWSSFAEEYREFFGFWFGLLFSPNPTIGETTLTIEPKGGKAFDENAGWELEVYSQAYVLKERKTKLRGKSTIIKTTGWKAGIYIVRVKYKDKFLHGKLMVKKYKP